MKTAIDSNVLLDLLSNDPSFGEHASNAIQRAIADGVVAICHVVYAELAVSFAGDIESLDQFLRQLGIHVDAFTPRALAIAAEAWAAYLRVRGRQAQCPHCGHEFAVTCPACHHEITLRQRVMPDFMVGAHALIQADTLLTRDERTYSRYFPQLTLRDPIQ